MDDKLKNDCTISVRVPRNVAKAIRMKALEKGIKFPNLLRKLITDYIEEDMSHENLVEKALVNVSGNLQELQNEQTLLSQLFLAFLNNWFLQHPEISKDNPVFVSEAVARKNEFLKVFFREFYDSQNSLFDMLFYMANEEDKGKEK